MLVHTPILIYYRVNEAPNFVESFNSGTAPAATVSKLRSVRPPYTRETGPLTFPVETLARHAAKRLDRSADQRPQNQPAARQSPIPRRSVHWNGYA